MPTPSPDGILRSTSRGSGTRSLIARDIHLTYRVYEEAQRPALKTFVTARLRPRPYRAVEALKGVSFAIPNGEAVGVIGRNGSGKSTLLRVLAGLLRPTVGEVFARSVPVLLGVAAVLNPELTGRRNVYLGATALGMSRQGTSELLDEIVEFAGLQDFIDVPMRAYSSGMQARLQFAIAASARPDILLIDEALSVGDAEFKAKSDERIRELVESAGTVFLVSHSMGSIRDICSRVLWLDQGKLVADGEASDVIKAYWASTRTTE